ncbi:MAG: LbtU family siderophore porin [Rickettsiales bacterium]|nr:LbtU family siderophore porin [Rickettsiales bacterium]MCA0254776.1 LbtU family siderophore porin [Pseudomonadota bacterium]
MNIIKFFSFILAISYFSISLANIDVVEDKKDISEKRNPSIVRRNQGIIQGDNYKIEGINFSGLIIGELITSNIDQNKNTRFATKGTYSTFCVPKINLYATSNLNEWATANIGLNFAPTSTDCSACGYGGKNDPSRFNKYDKIDEAHIVFANQGLSPYYAKVGIQYFNYGLYSPHSVPATFTQLLTQIQAPGVTIGYIPAVNGLNFSVFSFTDKVKKGSTSKISNFGAQVGYVSSPDSEKMEISLDILKNMASSVNYIVSSSQCCINPLYNSYRKVVPGLSLSIKKQFSRFQVKTQVTSALSKFDKKDVLWGESGAKPAALLLDFNYKFSAFNDKQNIVGVNYQKSIQAVNLKGNYLGRGLPEHRVQAYYSIEAWKNIELGAQIIWDKDYKRKNDGTGKTSVTSLITLIAKIM